MQGTTKGRPEAALGWQAKILGGSSQGIDYFADLALSCRQGFTNIAFRNNPELVKGIGHRASGDVQLISEIA